jgi:hypothetical protein
VLGFAANHAPPNAVVVRRSRTLQRARHLATTAEKIYF